MVKKREMLNSRKTISLLLFIVLLMFTSCGGTGIKTADSTTGDSSGQPSDNGISGDENDISSQNKDENALDDDALWEEKYKTIIQAYREGMSVNFEGYPPFEMPPIDPIYDVLCFAIVANTQATANTQNIAHQPSLLSKARYSFVDIDGNGVNELIIGPGYAWKDSYSGIFLEMIFDCWTIVDKEPQRLMVKQLGETDSIGILIGKGYIADTHYSDSFGIGVYEMGENGSLSEEAQWIPIYDFTSQNPSPEVIKQVFSQYGFDNGLKDLVWKDFESGKEIGPIPNFPKISVSSTRDPVGDNLYEPKYAVDGRYNTAWCEGAPGNGVGSWIELGADTPQMVSSIWMLNGYTKSSNAYYNNNTVAEAKIVTDEGEFIWSLSSDYEIWGQTFLFDKPIKTKSIRIIITKANEQGDREDTLISEIMVF